MSGSPSTPAPSPLPASATEEKTLVGLVHLLQEDEGEDGVGAQAGIVRCKALPQAEEALVADDLHQYILDRQAGKVLWLEPGLWVPATLNALPGPPMVQPKPPALLSHQPVFVFWLPINHSHVLDPKGDGVGV